MNNDDFMRDEQLRAAEDCGVPAMTDHSEGWVTALTAQGLWLKHVQRQFEARVPGPTIFLDEERAAKSTDDLKRMIRGRTPEQRERAKRGAEQAKLRVILPLRVGTPFFFSDRVCNLLEISAETVPADVLLERERIPCEHGFWYFEQPLPISTGSVGPIRAITWAGVCQHEGQEFHNLGGPAGFSVDGVEAIDIVFWLQTAVGSILPATHLRWLIGASCDQTAKRGNPLAEDPEPRLDKLKYLAAALTFIHQRVVATAPEIAGRPARRRLGLPEELAARPVHVVTLRRLRSAERQAAPGEVAWSCRWGVSGHWRNQPVGPKRGARRLTWVHGHVKGPTGKPFRHVDRVFAVRR